MSDVDNMTLTEINDLGQQWADMTGTYHTVRCHWLAHLRLNAHVRKVLQSRGELKNPEVEAKLAELEVKVDEMKDLMIKTKKQAEDLEAWYKRATPKGFP